MINKNRKVIDMSDTSSPPVPEVSPSSGVGNIGHQATNNESFDCGSDDNFDPIWRVQSTNANSDSLKDPDHIQKGTPEISQETNLYEHGACGVTGVHVLPGRSENVTWGQQFESGARDSVPSSTTHVNEKLKEPQSDAESFKTTTTVDNADNTAQQPGNNHQDEQGQSEPVIKSLLLQPLILTPLPHIPPLTPLIVDESALSEASASAEHAYRPVFRRLGSRRPPPTSPPEPVSHDHFSMPTLPQLHVTSVPALIEQYREERRLNPDEFDKHTMAIKHALVRAKVERGGANHLLNNEYTAELASRLDAEVIERWSTVRQHDQDTYIESDDDDDAIDINFHHATLHDDANSTASTDKSPVELIVVDSPTHGSVVNTTAETTTPISMTSSVNTIVPPTNTGTNTNTESPTAKYTRLANYTRKHATSGSVNHNSSLTQQVFTDGSQRYTHESWIKITQTVDLPSLAVATSNTIANNTDVSTRTALDSTVTGVHPNQPTTESPLEDIISSLINLRGDDGEGLSDELIEELEEVRMRVRAAKE